MFHTEVYNKINPTKSPASGAGNVSEPRLMLQVGTMREVVCRVDQCVSAVREATVPVFVSFRSNCNHRLGQGAGKGCETGTVKVVTQIERDFVEVILLRPH
jgi:hypothetical protein